MRILTDNLKSVRKVWNQVKVASMDYYDHVYLDFDNKKLAFRNDQIIVRVDLNLEDNDGNGFTHRNMYINGAKFFSLVQFYDYIDLDEKDIFYSSLGDKFQIPEIEEEFPENMLSFDDWEKYMIDFNPEINKELNTAYSYVDLDESSDFSALFLYKGSIIACTRYKFFLGKAGNGLAKADISIPLPLLKIITSLEMEGEIPFRCHRNDDGSLIIEFTYNGMWLRYGASSRYALPFDPDSDDFKSTYDHDNFIKVNLDKLNEVISMLSIYYVDVKDSITSIFFDLTDPSDKKLVFSVSYEQSGNVEYKIPIEMTTDDSYFEGKQINIYISFLKNAISAMKSFDVKDIFITYEDEAPAVAFIDAKEEAPIKVVHTIIEEL